jgi:hypothetical protein
MTEQVTEAVDTTPNTDSTQIEDTTIEATTQTDERTGTLAVEEATSEAETGNILDLITDEELKGSKSLAKFKDVNAMAKSLIHLEKKLGAPKEDVEYKADDYGYELPEGYEPNEEIMKSVKDRAIELGIKPDAFKSLVETFTGKENEILSQLGQDQKEQVTQMQESLKKEWGSNYEERLERADKTWQQFTSPEEDTILETLQPNAKIAIAKLMDNISQKINTPSIGKQEASSNPIDSVKALSMIKEIRGNSDMDPLEKNRELSKLYPIAYANETSQTLGVSTTGLDLSKLE